MTDGKYFGARLSSMSPCCNSIRNTMKDNNHLYRLFILDFEVKGIN